MADTLVGYYYSNEDENEYGEFFHDVKLDPAGGDYIYAYLCGGTPGGDTYGGRSTWSVVFKIYKSDLTVAERRYVRAYPQNTTNPYTCGQCINVYGDYVYAYPSYNNLNLLASRPTFIRLNKSTSELTFNSGKYFGTGVGTQCSRVDANGKFWEAGTTALLEAAIYTHNADFSVVKRGYTDQIAMPLSIFCDSGDYSNDVYFLTKMAMSNYDSATIVRFTQSGWGSDTPALTFDGGIAFSTAEGTPASAYTTIMGNYMLGACSDTTATHMWVSGMLINEDTDTKRDGLLAYIKKRDTNGDLEVVKAWRLSLGSGTDWDFGVGEVHCDSSYVYLTTFSAPHMGLGLDSQVSNKHSDTVLKLNKTNLLNAGSPLIVWSKAISGYGNKTAGIHTAFDGSYIYSAGFSNNKTKNGKPVCYLRKTDIAEAALAGTLYSSDGYTKITNNAADITITALTLNTDITATQVGSFSVSLETPSTIENMSDTTAYTTVTTSQYAVNSATATKYFTLHPGADGANSDILAEQTKYGGTTYSWQAVSDDDDDTYISWPDSTTYKTDRWTVCTSGQTNFSASRDIGSSNPGRIVSAKLYFRYKCTSTNSSYKSLIYPQFYDGSTWTQKGEVLTPIYNPDGTVEEYWDVLSLIPAITTDGSNVWTSVASFRLGSSSRRAAIAVGCRTLKVWLVIGYELYNIAEADGSQVISLNDSTTVIKDPAHTRWYGKRW